MTRRRQKKRTLAPRPIARRRSPRTQTKSPVPRQNAWPMSMCLRLIQLWELHDAQTIAFILSDEYYYVTRNAVIGKIHRLRETGLAGEIKRKGRL